MRLVMMASILLLQLHPAADSMLLTRSAVDLKGQNALEGSP
jgi:hypothetical protein